MVSSTTSPGILAWGQAQANLNISLWKPRRDAEKAINLLELRHFRSHNKRFETLSRETGLDLLRSSQSGQPADPHTIGGATHRRLIDENALELSLQFGDQHLGVFTTGKRTDLNGEKPCLALRRRWRRCGDYRGSWSRCRHRWRWTARRRCWIG